MANKQKHKYSLGFNTRDEMRKEEKQPNTNKFQ